MTWDSLLKVKTWTPLSQIQQEVEQVMPGVLKVDEGAYIRTQDYNQKLENNDPNAPFVTKAYWASSIEAVKRVVSGDPTASIGALDANAPTQLLSGTKGTYAELKAKIPSSEIKGAESAKYSNKGAFLYKQIRIGRFEYYFAGNDIVPDEKVFMIGVALLT